LTFLVNEATLLIAPRLAALVSQRVPRPQFLGEDGVMGRPRRYSEEFRERAVRLVREWLGRAVLTTAGSMRLRITSR